MYGTIARIHARPGTQAQLEEMSREYDQLEVPGFITQYVYRMDANPDEYYLVVIFESREAYRANASSPDQDARFRKMMALVQAEPEWHDGEIVHSHVFQSREQGR